MTTHQLRSDNKALFPQTWPPNSPALNSVDYSIWGALQQLVYHHRVQDIEHLTEVMQTCWEQIGQNVTDRAIELFHKRLSLVVVTSGRHIKHCSD